MTYRNPSYLNICHRSRNDNLLDIGVALYRVTPDFLYTVRNGKYSVCHFLFIRNVNQLFAIYCVKNSIFSLKDGITFFYNNFR